MAARSTPFLVALVALSTVAAAACGDDDGDDATLGPDDFSVLAALGELPAVDADTVQISAADVLAASEANGVERPESADDPAWYEWQSALTGGVADLDEGVFVVAPSSAMDVNDPDEYAARAGFSFLDADVFAAVEAPPEQFVVYAGEGIGDDQLGGDLVEVADGVVSDSDRADGEIDPDGDFVLDRVGRPVRFAQDGDRIATSLSTSQVEGWLGGDEPTLADDESLAAVAEVLDDAGAVSAAVFTFDAGAGGADPRLTPEARTRLGLDELPDGSAGTIGIGWSAEGDDFPITVVYDFGDEDAAEAWLDVLDAAYRDGVSIERGAPIADLVELDEIEVRGTLVVATVRPGPDGRPSTPFEMLVRRDLPFVTSR